MRVKCSKYCSGLGSIQRTKGSAANAITIVGTRCSVSAVGTMSAPPSSVDVMLDSDTADRGATAHIASGWASFRLDGSPSPVT